MKDHKSPIKDNKTENKTKKDISILLAKLMKKLLSLES